MKDYIVYIGRFQPPHLAHIQIIKESLKQAKKVLVMIGSSNQPRTIKNPWTFREREQMILDALSPEESQEVTFRPLHDITYNDQLWVKQIQETVEQVAGRNTNIGIIGHIKDDSSYYLDLFPQWELINVNNIEDINASEVRRLLFSSDNEEEFDLRIGRNLPPRIHDGLRAFMLREEFTQLVREFHFIAAYKSAWKDSPYEPIFVTVDSVVVQSGHILIVRRRSEPGRGLFALPGGFIGAKETIMDATFRELKEETKIKVPVPVLKGNTKETKVFDHPERSLRGRTITHATHIELPGGTLPKVKGSDDADKAKWVSLGVFSRMEDQMFEDHFHIVNYFVGEG